MLKHLFFLVFFLSITAASPAYALSSPGGPGGCSVEEIDISDIIDEELISGLDDDFYMARLNTQNDIIDLITCILTGSGDCEERRDLLDEIIKRLRELQAGSNSPEVRARIEQIILAIIQKYRNLCPRPAVVMEDPTYFPSPEDEENGDIPTITVDPYSGPYDY